MKPDARDGAELAPLPPGTLAPDFRLYGRPHQTLSLSSMRGQDVVLAFYPADWDPVSMEQLARYQEYLSELQRFDAVLLGISVDSVWAHAAYAREARIKYPLLADFGPKGAVAHSYGVSPPKTAPARGRSS